VDASTLVGELLREREQALLASPHLDRYVPARMWEEARHEVSRRKVSLFWLDKAPRRREGQ
jgi:hypothetical protein